MPRPLTRKGIVRKLDKAFSEYIIRRDGGKSVLSGKTESLTCGHLFSRVAYSARWDYRNGYCQTAGENLRHEFDPWPLMNYARFAIGQKAVDKLHSDWAKPKKFSDSQLLELLEKIKRDTEELPCLII